MIIPWLSQRRTRNKQKQLPNQDQTRIGSASNQGQTNTNPGYNQKQTRDKPLTRGNRREARSRVKSPSHHQTTPPACRCQTARGQTAVGAGSQPASSPEKSSTGPADIGADGERGTGEQAKRLVAAAGIRPAKLAAADVSDTRGGRRRRRWRPEPDRRDSMHMTCSTL